MGSVHMLSPCQTLLSAQRQHKSYYAVIHFKREAEWSVLLLRIWEVPSPKIGQPVRFLPSVPPGKCLN
jgi:hypothetical protein